jgi:OHCU decarboxylase
VIEVGTVDRDTFVARFGGVFEHSPWIAAATFDAGMPAGPLTAETLHACMAAALRAGSTAQKRALIAAHPDLAGRLARAGRLTRESAKEQASAGLDLLSDGERTRFTELNEAYKAKFGLPFVMAVKGRSKSEILAAFERRLKNDAETELATALVEIEKIALLRLKEMLP